MSISSLSDRYCETENCMTWDKHEPVKIEYGKEGTIEGIPSITVMTMFKRTVEKHGNKHALGRLTVISRLLVPNKLMELSLKIYECTLFYDQVFQ